jgi:8-oxo-dGTP pyrophosphatase MutT (NUDIX family)
VPSSVPVRLAGHPAAFLPLARLAVRTAAPRAADPGLRARGAPALAALRADRPALHDGRLLVLDRFDAGTLVVREGSYFDHLAVGLAVAADPQARATATALAGGDPLRDGTGRSAGIGVSVTCVVDGGTGLLLGRRRPDLAVEGGRWHVAPSGMLEAAPELPLHATAARECLEELGVTRPPGAFRLLGVGWDLRRLTPEIALRLDLEDGAGLASRLAPDEFTEGRVWPLADLAGFWAAHGPDELTPPAAAAVALLQASLRQEAAPTAAGGPA